MNVRELAEGEGQGRSCLIRNSHHALAEEMTDGIIVLPAMSGVLISLCTPPEPKTLPIFGRGKGEGRKTRAQGGGARGQGGQP